jgi:hypothetical protein
MTLNSISILVAKNLHYLHEVTNMAVNCKFRVGVTTIQKKCLPKRHV